MLSFTCFLPSFQHMNWMYGSNVPLVLMNSFNTHENTKQGGFMFSKRVELHMFEQRYFPRVDMGTLRPVPKLVDLQKDGKRLRANWYTFFHMIVIAMIIACWSSANDSAIYPPHDLLGTPFCPYNLQSLFIMQQLLSSLTTDRRGNCDLFYGHKSDPPCPWNWNGAQCIVYCCELLTRTVYTIILLWNSYTGTTLC